MIYPAALERDTNGTWLVTFPDFPEGATFGEDVEEALARGCDALETVIAARIDDREDVPRPSALTAGLHPVRLPALSAAKVMLWQAMRESGVRKAELARRLGWHVPRVDRLFDLGHASRLDQIEAAAHALGRRIDIAIEA